MLALLNSHVLSFDQVKRLEKCWGEFYYILDKDETSVKITGSKFNVYTIKFDGLKINCNCPDSKYCESKNIYCKHLCFLICIVGKLFKDNIFTSRELKEEDKIKIFKRLNSEGDDNIIFNKELKDKFDNINNSIISKDEFYNMENARNLDCDCNICYKILKKDDCYKCPVCLNSVHKSCMEMWLKVSDTCTYCRSDIWKIIKNKYINLS